MKMFYLRNYRGIHHLLGLIEFVILFKIFGINTLFESTLNNLPLQLIVLCLNFFVTQWSLRLSGIDYMVKKEMEEINGKK
jgi:hypothetical protein